ncbi:MAG: caspase family protein [Verrucomicrobia bacterium]|nr:caspase family protein [Verrucomicrobiota bacterium]
MEIVFPPDDPALFGSQLDLLERKKKPQGVWVVADASRRQEKLAVELREEPAGVPAPLPQPPPAGDPDDTTRALISRSVWNLPARQRREPGRRGSRRRARAGTVGSHEVRVLAVHGVGHGDVDPALVPAWTGLLQQGLAVHNPTLRVAVEFVKYDDLFDQAPHHVLTYGEALLRLGWSGVTSWWRDLRRGALAEGAEAFRWTAGMVAQWVENAELRAATRERLATAVRQFAPDVVVAHSLGSLVSYDTFSRCRTDAGKAWDGPELIRGRFFVSLGSQIGSRFTRQTLGGRVEPLAARHWFHLYNPCDRAFTAPLRLASARFDQVITRFDVPGLLDHEASEYFRHRAAAEGCWRSIALAEPEPPAPPRGQPGRSGSGSARPGGWVAAEEGADRAHRLSVLRPPVRKAARRRALLVGINDYPHPSDRLEGCVNDVFLMSSLLQEIGFAAEDIRVVLNDRATAAGVLDRLEWLLDGGSAGSERVFYYSGHGAQIPGYGVGEKVDHKDECLVTHDFDWSREHAVTDDRFHELYSQLPYETRFFAIFDCCHSGGLTRDGGRRIRGLTPPDDIRHRALAWDGLEEMWVPRDLAQLDAQRARRMAERRQHRDFFGEDGAVERLGRAAALRGADAPFDRARRAYGHHGPYLPVILQACREQEFSYEYRHGTQSYGAFSYTLAQFVREQRKAGRTYSWSSLVESVGAKLVRLGYDQRPALVCPKALRDQPVPWS